MLLAWLRLLLDPSDDSSFLVAMAEPKRELGEAPKQGRRFIWWRLYSAMWPSAMLAQRNANSLGLFATMAVCLQSTHGLGRSTDAKITQHSWFLSTPVLPCMLCALPLVTLQSSPN